jgi:hypothetical protein
VDRQEGLARSGTLTCSKPTKRAVSIATFRSPLSHSAARRWRCRLKCDAYAGRKNPARSGQGAGTRRWPLRCPTTEMRIL